MSCDLTGNISRMLKNLQGGIDTVYLFPFVNYSRSQIVLDGQYLDTFPTTTIYDIYSSATNYTENTEIEGGDVIWNQSFSIEIPKTNVGMEVYKFVKQDYRAIYIDRIGNIRILGLFNGLEASITNETAQDKAGFNGYKVSFTGKENNQAYFLTDLEDVGFTINDNNNYVFMDGCNYAFMDGTNYTFI